MNGVLFVKKEDAVCLCDRILLFFSSTMYFWAGYCKTMFQRCTLLVRYLYGIIPCTKRNNEKMRLKFVLKTNKFLTKKFV